MRTGHWLSLVTILMLADEKLGLAFITRQKQLQAAKTRTALSGSTVRTSAERRK